MKQDCLENFGLGQPSKIYMMALSLRLCVLHLSMDICLATSSFEMPGIHWPVLLAQCPLCCPHLTHFLNIFTKVLHFLFTFEHSIDV